MDYQQKQILNTQIGKPLVRNVSMPRVLKNLQAFENQLALKDAQGNYIDDQGQSINIPEIVFEEEEKENETVDNMKDNDEPEYESQEQSEDILPKAEEDMQFEEVNDESIDDDPKGKEECINMLSTFMRSLSYQELTLNSERLSQVNEKGKKRRPNSQKYQKQKEVLSSVKGEKKTQQERQVYQMTSKELALLLRQVPVLKGQSNGVTYKI